MSEKQHWSWPPHNAPYVPYYGYGFFPWHGYNAAPSWPNYCSSDHEGKDVGLTYPQQHHHHRTGHHHHWYPAPTPPAPAYHQPAHPHHYGPQYPHVYYPQPHYHQYGPPYPATPPAQPVNPPPNESYYVPSGQVPSAEAHGKTLWHGRSRAEVEEDDQRVAHASGAYASKEIKPRDAKSDDMFVVIYPDGRQGHVSFATIEGAGWKGRWQQDAYGRMYFLKEGDD